MSKIIIKINGRRYEVDGKFSPDVSLNDYIRNVADLRGTKAMCHEGGCGACVVGVRAAVPPKNEIKLFSVNSCLVSVLSCHNWEIITADGLGNKTIGYHEIQKRLAQFNGTQCGYCTPGWIMNMYCVYEGKNKKLSSKEVENSFASQICRCTGYRPIADAFKSFATDADQKLLDKIADMEDLGLFKTCGAKCSKQCSHKKEMYNDVLLGKLNINTKINSNTDKSCEEKEEEEDWCLVEKNYDKMLTVEGPSHRFYKAYKLSEVFAAIAGSNNDYKLIAGNTGQGVYHVMNYPTNVIDIFDVVELKGYILDVNLVLGAGMPLSEMMELFLKLSAQNQDFAYLKQFYNHMDLVAHIPVRNIGTIGGNLFLKYANNEFQSDVFLIFETVGGMITIADGVNSKVTMTFPQFLKYDMSSKVILNVMLPPLSNSYSVRTYKIMPRQQNAHAVVNAGFLFKFKPNTYVIEKASIVYGSISPKFIHAYKTEAALVGRDLYTNETLQVALKSLAQEVKPEEAPAEPGAAYRKMLALALFYKAILYLSPNERIDPRYRSGGKAIKRGTSKGTQIFDTDKNLWPLNQPVPKLEALVQCSGEATFANDLPKQVDEVYAAFVTADVKPGSIISDFDASEALRYPGVIAFYSAKDIPGQNTFTPSDVPLMVAMEEILCSKEVAFFGQPCGIIVADRDKTANKAAKMVKIRYSKINQNKPLINIDEVMASPQKNKRVTNNSTIEPTEIGNDVKSVVYGGFKIEGQYHYTMEPQTCVVKPSEDGLEVYSATQWLDLVNVAVAKCVKMPINSVNVIVRRVGGGYGCKITRASQIACAAAIVCRLQGRTCRFVLPIQTNMKIIGKRIPTNCEFEVGINKGGQIQYLKQKFYQDNGCSPNETVTPLTAIHFKNGYDSKRWRIEANSVATDMPSNTWCRAPSSTEGLAMVEYIMEYIAHSIGKDPLQVRFANMPKDSPLPELINQLKNDADYDDRLKEISQFNAKNRWRKRALKLIPMSYDLFYFGNYNTIVSIYHSDGSVVLTHGGIEMGQGINTKAAQVCAYMFGIPLEKISVKPSTSFTSPNSMATGGSIGSECIALATMKACNILLERLKPIKEKMGKPDWQDLITKAFGAGIDLQASYMYSAADGLKPYDIYGVVALEVELDILTGNHDVRRVDLLEDVGRSINPEIDVAQIEGAFTMGLGYWTSEKIVYDPNTGELLSDRTWTYKPPGIKDIPADFRVYFRRNSTNPNGVLQSKATGEPAFCLATVVIHSIREAINFARIDAGYADQWFDLKMPCNVESIFMAVNHKLEHFKLLE